MRIVICTNGELAANDVPRDFRDEAARKAALAAFDVLDDFLTGQSVEVFVELASSFWDWQTKYSRWPGLGWIACSTDLDRIAGLRDAITKAAFAFDQVIDDYAELQEARHGDD